MNLSIIIPAYNDLERVLRCVQAVVQTTNPHHTEVLVQDDCSPNVILPDLLGSICQRNPENLGFPGNCNAGAKRARGDVLMFLNHDIWVTQRGWDARLRDFFESTPQAGVAGPTLLFPPSEMEPIPKVQSVGGAFDALGQPYHIALGYHNHTWLPIATPRRVGWVTGAALAVRASVWHELGGFDTAYIGGYFEDVDFCLRAKQAGYEVWHRPNIIMYHAVGSTGGNPHFMHNALLFKQRWVDTKIVQPDENIIREGFWA